MKQMLLIAAVALMASSCNEKHCWNCRIDYKNSLSYPTSNGKPGTGVINTGVCDMNKKEIKQYETENSKEDAANASSIKYDCVRDYRK